MNSFLREIVRWFKYPQQYFQERRRLRNLQLLDQQKQQLFVATNMPLGRRGECYAAIYLQEHGVKILERNYVRMHYEIDLIGAKRNTIYFFEVKTRSYPLFRPACSVSTEKKKRIHTVANVYIKENHFDLVPVRYKYVTIEIIWPESAKEPESIRFLDFHSGFDSTWNPLND